MDSKSSLKSKFPYQLLCHRFNKGWCLRGLKLFATKFCFPLLPFATSVKSTMKMKLRLVMERHRRISLPPKSFEFYLISSMISLYAELAKRNRKLYKYLWMLPWRFCGYAGLRLLIDASLISWNSFILNIALIKYKWLRLDSVWSKRLHLELTLECEGVWRIIRSTPSPLPSILPRSTGLTNIVQNSQSISLRKSCYSLSTKLIKLMCRCMTLAVWFYVSANMNEIKW